MLLDPDTFALTSGVERLLGPLGRTGLKTELFSCLVETNTPICETPAELLGELERLRATVQTAAEREGLVVAAAGAHPFSRPEEQSIVPEPRYLALLAERPAAKRQLVCGLHVHVGMTSFEQCLETQEAILPWLPAVLALSVNSPFLEPIEPGVLSGRAGRLLELPRSGPPPILRDRAEWEGVVAGVSDYTKLWWDVRPHPRLGTLEIRVADQQTSVQRTAALAALLQALCAVARPAGVLDRRRYLDARARATRGDADTDTLFELVEPAVHARGASELGELLHGPPEAHAQLEVGRSGRVAVAADLVRRSQ